MSFIETINQKIPESGQNNLWFKTNESKSAIVFVHGVLSDSRNCWLNEVNEDHPVYWPSLIDQDPRTSVHSVFLGGYYTTVDAGAYEIADCAYELLNSLELADLHGNPPVINKEEIVFVCHSTGGIVVRHMLVRAKEKFKNKKVGLVLIASPSYGSKWGNRLNLLTEIYKHHQGMQLKWGSWSLRELDDDFKNLIHSNYIEKLHGVEAYENHFIVHRKFLPDKSLVVTKESAGRYFGKPVLLRKTDHFSSVKPSSLSHPAHTFLVSFLTEYNFGDGNTDDTEITTRPTSTEDTDLNPNSETEATMNSHEKNMSADDQPLHDLETVPIGPAIKPNEIPLEVIDAYVAKFETLQSAKAFVSSAMRIRLQANTTPKSFSEQQIIVRPGDMPVNPDSMEEFWWRIFALAGNKSRRTVAALLDAPGAPQPEFLEKTQSEALLKFNKLVRNLT